MGQLSPLNNGGSKNNYHKNDTSYSPTINNMYKLLN